MNIFPEPCADDSPSERMAKVRAILDAFDWELDDRQYALEAIEAVVTA